MLEEYGLNQMDIILYFDNLRDTNISKKLVEHSRTKHIGIKYHNIMDLVEHNILSLEHVPTQTSSLHISSPGRLHSLHLKRFDWTWVFA